MPYVRRGDSPFPHAAEASRAIRRAGIREAGLSLRGLPEREERKRKTMSVTNEQHDPHERMLAAALAQIALFVDSNFEHISWARQAFPENLEALDRLRPDSLREAFALPPAAFATLMGCAVSLHVHLHQLWKLREQAAGPVTLPTLPFLN
jgi:hypothetical protein